MKKLLLIFILCATLSASDISVSGIYSTVPYGAGGSGGPAGGEPTLTWGTGTSNTFMMQDSNEINSSVFETWAMQLNYSNPAQPTYQNRVCLTCGYAVTTLPSISGSYGTYFSSCTNGTQTVSYTNNITGTNYATGTVTVSGGVPTGSITYTAMGSNYSALPTQGAISSCTGTGTFTGGTVTYLKTALFGYSSTTCNATPCNNGAPSIFPDGTYFSLSVANPSYYTGCTSVTRPQTPGQGCANDMFVCPISFVSGSTPIIPNASAATSGLCTNVGSFSSGGVTSGLLYSAQGNETPAGVTGHGIIAGAVRVSAGTGQYPNTQATGAGCYEIYMYTYTESPFVATAMSGSPFNPIATGYSQSCYFAEMSGYFGGTVSSTSANNTDNGILYLTMNARNQPYWRWQTEAFNYKNPGITLASFSGLTGVTGSGSGTCTITVTGGGGANGSITIPVTTGTLGSATIANAGGGWSSAPTTGTVAGACSGTPTFTTTISGTTNLDEIISWGRSSTYCDWVEHFHPSDPTGANAHAIVAATHQNPTWLSSPALACTTTTSPVANGVIPPLDYWEITLWYTTDILGYTHANSDVETYGHATRLTWFNIPGTTDYLTQCQQWVASSCPNSVSGGDAQVGPNGVYFIGINAPLRSSNGSSILAIVRNFLPNRH